jgi:hypothetical protein
MRRDAAKLARGVNRMFSTETYLMAAIFHHILEPDDNAEYFPEFYVRHHAERIFRAGQLFEYFGLAEQNSKSPLGWSSTPHLIGLIAKCVLENSPRQKLDKSNLPFASLWPEVFGENKYVEADDLGLATLYALGVLGRDHANSEAAAEMKEFFKWGYRGPRPGSYRRDGHQKIT